MKVKKKKNYTELLKWKTKCQIKILRNAVFINAENCMEKEHPIQEACL